MSASEHLVPSVTIHLDRERHLRYDFNALIRLEKQTGQSVLDGKIWDNLTGPGGPERVAAILWAGLLREDPEITLDYAASLIDMRNLQSVLSAVKQAWAAGAPE